MKRKMLFVSLLLLCLTGCSFLESATPETPLGTLDPNEVQGWIDTAATAAAAAGEGATTIGAAVGNPAVAGAGVLLLTIAGILGGIKLTKKK